MRLYSGAPYWLLRDGLSAPNDCGGLSADQACDVLVVGAGITGALVADTLASEGVDVVVVDRREPGLGSTAASTALLLYETDAELAKLAGMVGEKDAVRSYALGLESIREIDELTRALPSSSGFSFVTGLYLSSHRKDIARLTEEVALRRSHGFDVEWIDAAELRRAHRVEAHGAIRSMGAAMVDPLALTRQLLARAQSRGARTYRGTTVAAHQTTASGMEVRTTEGWRLRAGRVVYATGYETPPSFPDGLVRLHSTFALVTERSVHDEIPSLEGVALWESARPYAYLRSTPDGRVMIGGRDAPFQNEALRDTLLPGRIPDLEKRLGEILPDLHRETAFSWSGTFGDTRDSLPFVGALPGEPCVLYALGYGGNGITFSAIAARIIADACQGRRNDDARIFAIER